MRIIIPNIWLLLLRLILLALLIYIYQWPFEKIQNGQYQDNLPVFVIGLILFSLFPFYIIWTLFGVLWVTFSEDSTKINFHHFYKTIKTNGSDIESYFRTIHKTRIHIYNGIIIKLKTEEVIELTEYNLSTLQSINEFLNENKVAFRGFKKSWFPLKRRV